MQSFPSGWFQYSELVPMDAIQSQPPAIIAPARDGNVAIQEELQLARKRGTVAAYDLFIERHPGHPLVNKAKEERDRLLSPKE